MPTTSHGCDSAVTAPRASVERSFGIGEAPGVRGASRPSRRPRRGGLVVCAGARYVDAVPEGLFFFLLLTSRPPARFPTDRRRRPRACRDRASPSVVPSARPSNTSAAAMGSAAANQASTRPAGSGVVGLVTSSVTPAGIGLQRHEARGRPGVRRHDRVRRGGEADDGGVRNGRVPDLVPGARVDREDRAVARRLQERVARSRSAPRPRIDWTHTAIARPPTPGRRRRSSRIDPSRTRRHRSRPGVSRRSACTGARPTARRRRRAATARSDPSEATT